MIKELIQKLVRGRSRDEGFYPDKVTPDEVELNSYLEKERKERVRKMLDYYRKKKEQEYWNSRKILQGKLQKKAYSRNIILKEGRIL